VRVSAITSNFAPLLIFLGKNKNMLKHITIIICLVFCLSACKPQPENEKMSPEMAKNMLKLKGYNFDEKNYLDAVRKNDVSAVLAFYDAGINANAINENKVTALNFAILSSEPKVVKIMLDKCDLNLKDNNGNTPLYLAYKEKKADLVDLLLEKGASADAVGRDNNTLNQSVLYLAVIRDDIDLIKKLLDKGANPSLADSNNATPLTEACVSSGDLEIVKLLLDKNADVNVKETNDGTALTYAAGNTSITAEKRTELVKMLLAKGADKTIKDGKGRTALENAKEKKHTEIIDLLK
jgi:ankyrin repeat protein